MLHCSIIEEEKKEMLFTFIKTALLWLDSNNEIANFHLILLLEITKYLSCYPDISDIDLKYFEMSEGCFSHFHARSSLTEHETNLFKRLLHLKFDNNQNSFHLD